MTKQKLTEMQKLAQQINLLTVFSNLRQMPLFQHIHTFFQVPVDEFLDLKLGSYSCMVAEIYEHGGSITEYIKDLVLNDENFYIKGCGTGKVFPKTIQIAVEKELDFLSKIADLSPALMAKELKEAGYSGFLPQWEHEKINLLEIYNDRISHIKETGFGIYAQHCAFYLGDEGIMPVAYPDPQRLEDLPGYERERSLVIQNTEALLKGLPANNVLLYGDAGTGKSSTIKAILNEYKDQGLRLLEIKKEQLFRLPSVLEELSTNPLKFILFIDDLSFTGNDDNFSALKAVLEGSVSAKSSNVAIYATSNRRHLVKENMSERNGDDLHLNDTIQETLSLSARFGLTVTFQTPDRDCYLNIVYSLAEKAGVDLPKETLAVRAEAYAIRNGGRSPRAAQHFIQLAMLDKLD